MIYPDVLSLNELDNTIVSVSDDQWLSLFEKYFTVEKIDHFAWPGEEKEARRLFILRKK